MKDFRVVSHRDGVATKDENGTRKTEIIRMELRFAAETIQDVWEALPKYIAPDETIIAIIEESPAIIVLPGGE